MAELGREWRRRAAADEAPPPSVSEWWEVCFTASATSISELRNSTKVVDALLHLVAAADEACSGIGIPSASPEDLFEFKTIVLLLTRQGHTLCREIDPTRAIVLPKTRTPQIGMSLRSLTMNLALYLPGEVVPKWSWRPSRLNKDQFWRLNLLLLPWPLEPLPPRHFDVADSPHRQTSGTSGYFTSNPRGRPDLVERVREAFWGAQQCVKKRDEIGTIDGIVFPELALEPGEPARIAQATGAFVVAGIHEARMGSPARNDSAVVVPPMLSVHRQAKHHRWRIDANQINQYGLQHLSGDQGWWEDIDVGRRELTFFSLNDWFTFCVLICEDLARPDPSTELLRSIGPNLVIALLMDGPQLKSRWSARYASVLADDPGSSVLTLTSLGMVLSSVPVEYQERRTEYTRSRTIALWKDIVTGAHEISVDEGKVGVVLRLKRRRVEEWTADGRSSGKTKGVLCFDEVLPVERSMTPVGENGVDEGTDLASSPAPMDGKFARDETRLAVVGYWIARYKYSSDPAIQSDPDIQSAIPDAFQQLMALFETDDGRAVAEAWYKGEDSDAPNAFESVAKDISKWAYDSSVSRRAEPFDEKSRSR